MGFVFTLYLHVTSRALKVSHESVIRSLLIDALYIQLAHVRLPVWILRLTGLEFYVVSPNRVSFLSAVFHLRNI